MKYPARRSSSRAVALVFTGLTALVGCSNPPGPEPATPAPTTKVWVMIEGPTFPGDTRAFPAIWDGQTQDGYFRREILLDRYYAV